MNERKNTRGLTRTMETDTGAIDATARTLEAVASTEAIDSFGTILRCTPEAVDLVRFNANPVLLAYHDDKRPPVGQCRDMRAEGGKLRFLAAFDDITAADREVWAKYRARTMRGFSVRFLPLAEEVINVEGRDVIVYTRWELLEVSCVPVPSNSGALALALAAAPSPVRTSATSPKNTAPRSTSTPAKKEDPDMASLAHLERQIADLVDDRQRDNDRAEVRALVARHLDEIPESLHDFARGLAPKNARAFVESYRVAATSEGRNEAGISRDDADKLDRILGIMPKNPTPTGFVGFGAFDPTRGARTFHAPTPGEFRALQTKRGK